MEVRNRSRSTGDLKELVPDPNFLKKDKVTETGKEALGQISWVSLGMTILFKAAIVTLFVAVTYISISVAVPILLHKSPFLAIGFGFVLGTALGIPLMVVT